MFSGWIYKELPSLNVVEHPVYDVWPKSCEMTYPAGPPAPAAPVTSSNRSSAPKSAGAPGTRRGRCGAGPTPAAPLAAERGCQQRDIGLARHAHRAERGEMIGHELAVEQSELPALSRATSQASATLDASRMRLNMLSPKKARPSFTP